MPATGWSVLACCDATPEIGAGHAMRVLNFLSVWRRLYGGSATIAGNITLPFVRDRIDELQVSLSHDLPQRESIDLLVVDTYDEARRSRLAEYRARVRMLLDDIGSVIPAGYDFVWNPNAVDSRESYRGFAGEVLSGPAFVPVREGLPLWKADRATHTLGIILGGSTPPPTVFEAISALVRDLGPDHICCAGDWAPDEWTSAPSTRPWDALVSCDRALVGCGATLWEAAVVGIPAVALQTVENQNRGAEWARLGGVPVVDATQIRNQAGLANRMATALDGARPLPRLNSGSTAVARAVQQRLINGPSAN